MDVLGTLKPIDTLDYRGFHVDFFDDPYGQQIYTEFEGKTIGFGSFNTQYKDDMISVIDDRLDTITRFKDNPRLFGGKLEFFDNSGHRDIRLLYRLRVLKVYLVDGEPGQSSIQEIEEDATRILLDVIQNNQFSLN